MEVAFQPDVDQERGVLILVASQFLFIFILFGMFHELEAFHSKQANNWKFVKYKCVITGWVQKQSFHHHIVVCLLVQGKEKQMSFCMGLKYVCTGSSAWHWCGFYSCRISKTSKYIYIVKDCFSTITHSYQHLLTSKGISMSWIPTIFWFHLCGFVSRIFFHDS